MSTMPKQTLCPLCGRGYGDRLRLCRHLRQSHLPLKGSEQIIDNQPLDDRNQYPKEAGSQPRNLLPDSVSRTVPSDTETQEKRSLQSEMICYMNLNTWLTMRTNRFTLGHRRTYMGLLRHQRALSVSLICIAISRRIFQLL